MKVLSDTHFNHSNILKFCRQQFATLEDMNEHIIQLWNSKIAKDEKVYHLGDFAFGSDLESIENIIKRLNGNITLILGNHDTAHKVKELYVKHFKCLGSLTMGKYYLTHEPIHYEAINPAQLRSDGRQAVINLHGHLHNGNFCSENHINCCIDVVGLDVIVSEFDE